MFKKKEEKKIPPPPIKYSIPVQFMGLVIFVSSKKNKFSINFENFQKTENPQIF